MVAEEEEVWGQQDETLTCRECKQTFVFSKGEQIFYRQQGLDSKPGRCKPCLRGLKAKPPVVLSAKAEVKKTGAFARMLAASQAHTEAKAQQAVSVHMRPLCILSSPLP